MKKLTYRNKKYLEYIRSLTCCATGDDWNVVAHHVRIGQGGGMGLKPSDYRCIPLTADQHGALHQMGERTYYNNFQVDPDVEMSDNLQSYLIRTLEDMEPSEKVVLLEKLIELAEDENA